MNDLPSGWVETTLDTVADWGSGGTPKAGTASYYGGPIPWAIIGDLTDGIVRKTAGTITELGLRNSSAKVIDTDVVLIAMYGSIGKLGLPVIPMATNQAIAFARPRSGVLMRGYLFYYLMHARHRLAAAGKGATQQNISQTILKAWRVQLAPFGEQQRIVAAIEEQFSRLDAGVAALERVRQNIKRMRAAIFESAVTEWAGEGFPQMRLGDVLREPLRNGHSAKTDPLGTIPILALTAVTLDDFGAHNIKMTAADPRRVRDLWIQPGDLLIERSNTRELVGTACLYRGLPNLAVYPDLIIRARVNGRVVPEYAELVLKAPRSRLYFQQRAQGISGTMPKIDQQAIEDLVFTLPPPEVQAAIVQEAERKLTLLGSLQKNLELVAKRSSALRSSILTAAFSGQLASQDPKDEPASILLERITAAHTASNGHKPTRTMSKRRAPQEKVVV